MNSTERIDFIIIGAQKSGTTSLDKYLRKHPTISMARNKEVHFFDNDQNFQGEIVDYDTYHSHFPKLDSETMLYGECTPSYLYMEKCADRIAKYNPNIKLIAVLRNPAERAFSQWLMQKKRGIENRTFEKCIRSEWDIIQNGNKVQKKFAYVRRGFYSKQIKTYLEHFSKSQVMFIKYSDYVEHAQTSLRKIFSFINVNHESFDLQVVEGFIRNKKRMIQDEQRAFLNAIYQKDINQLEKLLDWDCSDWLQ